MDLWAWVNDRSSHYYETDPEFAEAIDHFPLWVVDRNYAQVESTLPDLLKKARANDDPWLEVYFRHWNLQAQIFQRHRVTDLEHEIVDLLNFSHKDETSSCPQSVCVVQDFAHYYGLVDGPAYTEERKQIVEETLERISPDWPCFGCLVTEYSNALIDAGQSDQAVEYIHEQNRKGRGDAIRGSVDLCLALAEALLTLDKFQEVIDLLRTNSFRDHGDYFQTQRSILQAHAWAGLGDPKKANSRLPSFDVIEETPRFYLFWIKAYLALLKAGKKRPDAEDFAKMSRMAENLTRHGAYRQSFDLYVMLAQRQLEADDRTGATKALQLAEAAQKNLRYPEQAAGPIQAIKKELSAEMKAP